MSGAHGPLYAQLQRGSSQYIPKPAYPPPVGRAAPMAKAPSPTPSTTGSWQDAVSTAIRGMPWPGAQHLSYQVTGTERATHTIFTHIKTSHQRTFLQAPVLGSREGPTAVPMTHRDGKNEPVGQEAAPQPVPKSPPLDKTSKAFPAPKRGAGERDNLPALVGSASVGIHDRANPVSTERGERDAPFLLQMCCLSIA